MAKPKLSKKCPVCKSVFFKPYGYGKQKWEERVFCSLSCGATKLSFNKDSVPYLYVVHKLSSTEIGKYFNISGVHAARILKKKGVATRSLSYGKRLSHNKPETIVKIRISSTGRRLSEAAKNKLRLLTGPKNAQWKGGITLTVGGYLQFTNSPENGDNAGKSVHRAVAEEKYNRSLGSDEYVHHLDLNKTNNDPDNLVVLSASEHMKLHFEEIENGKRLQRMARHG